ncbi:Mlo family protein [Nitzschia inconspicua]|uniref:Mlo family protein n=1 Tax=Nitzschia inconspicua TaxID=303405 RepID=A0A9K3PCW8_9STRA|nr:Mlo family protein [Nitzschia inconspicua]
MSYLSGKDDEGYLQSATSVLTRLLEEAVYDNGTEFTIDAYESYGDEYGYYDTKKKTPVPLDYSVLSIGILTLGLILFVEVTRHWIDHQAHGKPFFNAVLLMLYSELATLGIVEFCVFVLIKYYSDLDKNKKEVFGDVHFALFYTSFFNAIQSTLTALFTRQASYRLWVQTEQLELDHYVEIREEYERVSSIIGEHDAQSRLRKWIRNVLLFVRQPGLRRKYNNLRVQVRFHELRLQFLETHHLPLNFKVSEYLKRSEMGVLIGLVHISGTAWLLLTGGLALLYFILGMVGYKTADVDVLGTCMTGVFFGLLFAFIIASIALQYKMERIFQSIMKTKIDDTDKEDGLLAQKNLFWFGSPSLVVSLIQFMNFGYAIALATVIMYWPYLTLVEPYWYLLAVFGCYSVFLYNLSALLPQFTLCTSLGYLTNFKQLQETVAHHRLQEAQRRQRRKMIETAIAHDSIIVLAAHENTTEQGMSLAGSGTATPKTVASVMRSDAGGIIPVDDDPKVKLLAELVKSDTMTLRNQLPKDSRSNLTERENRRSLRKKSISDGVAAMRTRSSAAIAAWGEINNGAGSEKSHTITRKEKLGATRHNRRKSISQPGLIKGWQDITVAGNDDNTKVLSVDDIDAEHNRHKSSSESRVIKAWQDSQKLGSSDSYGNLLKSGDVEGPSFIKKDEVDDLTPKWKRERTARLAERRQARKKTQSASAVIQSWRDFSVTDQEPQITRSRGDLPVIPSERLSEIEHELSMDEKTFRALDNETTKVEVNNVRNDMDGTSPLSSSVVDLADAVIIEEENALPPPPSKSSTPETYSEEAYDLTVDSDRSIGSLSDVDVFESTRGATARNIFEAIDPFQLNFLRFFTPVHLAQVARLYFLGNSYPIVSHVFGTLVVFFIIGHRVEAFIALSGFIIEVDSFGWATNLFNMFWSEAVFLMCFIIADIIILVLFPSWETGDRRKKIISTAALTDLVLTGTVMVLLFVAEAQRCCAGDDSQARFRLLAAKIGQNYDFEEDCTCMRWGSRTFTGLGMIEPFTSIIALRIFRFVFASFLVSHMTIPSKGKVADKLSEDAVKDHSSHPHSPPHGEGGHGHGGGMALELWEQAITQYPEIVEKYGQFSGELLQAMLGLQVDLGESEDIHKLSHTESVHIDLQDRNQKIENSEKPETWQSHIKLTGPQYAKLIPEAQGLIIAGKLGKPVKSMIAPIDKTLSRGLLPTVDEGTAESNHSSFPGLVEFEIDKEQMLAEQTNEFNFVAPFARLVRSMRRCDRRHLPLLTNWLAVDVVMTQFEIVYFEAKDGPLDPEAKQVALLSALQATKGGKGLRLCDVATGRKVVGHLDLADVNEIHVEQDGDAVCDVSLLEKAAERYHSKNDIAVEYWHDHGLMETDTNRFARAIRWTIMKEERLKLTTLSGTLVLRFYSDLEWAENERIASATETHTLNQNIALQWAETVARIVGQDQLKQALPHFGENNEDELRDYLEVVHFHNKEAEKARKKTDRGAIDLHVLYGEGEDPGSDHERESSSRLKKSILNRPKSFGETNEGSERSIPRPNPFKILRRSVSMGAPRNSDDEGSKIEAPSAV